MEQLLEIAPILSASIFSYLVGYGVGEFKERKEWNDLIKDGNLKKVNKPRN